MPEDTLVDEAVVIDLPQDTEPERAADAEEVFAEAVEADFEEGRLLGNAIDTEDDLDNGGIA